MAYGGNINSHKAHIYSDAKSNTYNDPKNESDVDSWDSQGIFQKLDFELTTMELKPEKGQKNTSPV